ncbi:ditrans,polycis-polyprenyl diphosphate synthase [Saccharomyces eubayanus]|uniref:ditrans,polycis-polyprenyl diphosphate synthase n=1 Tax=Saccharomyces eubayanus TaxID=1080349 RepID=UPI0006BFB983|nr:SRT1-like protein [Saccharomyces eubayanus]KOG97440.1 SRT1-like protein [Saccharomyces eubayanus]
MKVPSVIQIQFVALRRLLAETKEQFCFAIKNKLRRIFGWIMSFSLFSWLYRTIQNFLIKVLSVGPVPEHVSFIMDGNRRYAKSRKLPVKKGHEAGGLTLLTLLYICKRLGVRCVSAYAFSIENFNRPKEEVDTLMNLFTIKLDEFAKRANDYKDPLYGSKIRIVGDQSLLSPGMREKIAKVEEITKHGGDFTLYICFPYTSRNDILHTIQGSVQDCLQSKSQSKIDIKKFTNKMYMDFYSNKCELLIRTSGHRRLSDYMLWQVHENATIEFSDTLWPNFSFLAMYLMILKWSFFCTIQRYNERNHTLFERVYEGVPSILKRKKTSISLHQFPNPPISVSITGED